jgi:hypothetical protein
MFTNGDLKINHFLLLIKASKLFPIYTTFIIVFRLLHFSMQINTRMHLWGFKSWLKLVRTLILVRV